MEPEVVEQFGAGGGIPGAQREYLPAGPAASIIVYPAGLDRALHNRGTLLMAAAHRHPHHGHDRHDRAHPSSKRGLFWTLLLLCGYLVAEVVGGLIAHSLALLADAGHMFSDVAALGLSLFALWMAERPPTPQRTYGYYRTEILAALANGAALLAVSVFIFLEAVRRFRQPPEVQGGVMLAIAVGGLLVNLAGLRFWAPIARRTSTSAAPGCTS